MTFELHKSGKKISAKFSVLGLNLSNNGSVCVMRDGKIAFYLESERITRKKRDHTIRSLFKYVHDIDAIAICDSYWVGISFACLTGNSSLNRRGLVCQRALITMLI